MKGTAQELKLKEILGTAWHDGPELDWGFEVSDLVCGELLYCY